MKKKLLCGILIASMVIGISGCSIFNVFNTKREGKRVVNLLENDNVMDKYMNAIEEYDDFECEEVYYDWGGRSIGPTEYRYRGIIYLTDEEAQRLWDKYEWAEYTSPSFEFEKIDISDIGDGPWYYCNEFNSDNYSTIVSSYTVFDGEKIVFDIHQI